MATPKSAQIAADLRAAIGRGDLAKGQRLPGEQTLADQYDVARGTVRAALGLLINEGLLVSRVGSGNYVADRAVLTYHAARAERHDGRGETDAYVSEVEEEGRVPSQDFAMRIEPASELVAAQLHVEPDELVVVRACFRYVDSEPWSDQVSYYPMDVSDAAGLAVPHDIEEGTIRAMAKAGHVEVGYVDTITARMPTPEQAARLRIDRGVPLIGYSRTAWTDTRPVRLTVTLFPSDRNEIVYELGNLSAMVDAAGDPA